MSFSTLGLILASVTISACAQLLLKLGVTAMPDRTIQAERLGSFVLSLLLRPYVVAGTGLYGLSMLLWLVVLGRTDLSQAYPFVGIGFVLTALFGAIILHEPLGPARLIGTALIVGGIVFMARS